jgi:fructose-1,6-bisphosphatase class II
MDRNLALELVRVTEAAALASARFMGRGDEADADRAAVTEMHRLFENIECNGLVVIGEGEKEVASMLYVEESLGTGKQPHVEIALDALEGATACATGAPNAISVIATVEHGSFLRCPPQIYMDKIAVGPIGKGVVDLDKPAAENLAALAKAKGVRVDSLTVVVLDRPRHDGLIAELREVGVRVKLISDGDLTAALATTRDDSGIDMLLGTGGAWQGVITAAAMRCLDGEFQGRFWLRNKEQEIRQLHQMKIFDMEKKYTAEDLVSGSVVFAATGVTTGDYLQGVRFFRGGALTNSVMMRSTTHTIRFMESYHHFTDHPEF